MRPMISGFGCARAASIVGGLATIALAGIVLARSPQSASSVTQVPVTQVPVMGRNFISLLYTANGPIGGESLGVWPDRGTYIETHRRFHHPMQRSRTVVMSPAQFHHMIALINVAGLVHLPARVGRRIMDGGVITVSVSYYDRKHQSQTVTVFGGDPTLVGLSQLQNFLGDFLNTHLK